MDVQTTQFVFFGIVTLAACVWTHSLVKAIQMSPRRTDEDNPWAVLPDEAHFTTDDESGKRTLRGDLDTVSRAIARAMLNQSIPGMFSTLFQIAERTPEKVLVRKTGPLFCNQPPGLQFSEVEFNLTPYGPDTVQVSYRIGYGQLKDRMRKIALGVILGAGLPCLVIGGWLMWHYVVTNPNPAVRWQVFQTLQVVHVLWPPFLFLHQFKSGRQHSRTYVSNLLMSAELADGVAPVMQ